MLQHLAHVRLVNLGGGNEAIKLGRVVQRINGGRDVGERVRRLKSGLLEQVGPVDNHLRPAIDRNGSGQALEVGHFDGARAERVDAQFLNDLVVGFCVENARFGPGERVLLREIDHIGKITGGKGGRGACAHVGLRNRDDLDRVACHLLELRRHRLLALKAGRLFFCRPEPDRFGLRHRDRRGGDQQRAGQLDDGSH